VEVIGRSSKSDRKGGEKKDRAGRKKDRAGRKGDMIVYISCTSYLERVCSPTCVCVY